MYIRHLMIRFAIVALLTSAAIHNVNASINKYSDTLNINVDPKATPNARAILLYLQSLKNKPSKKFLSGQQAVVRNYSYYHDFDSIQAQTGKRPAIIGIDYFHWTENGRDFQFDSSTSNRAARDHWKKGGLIFMSSHMYNPITGCSGNNQACSFPSNTQARQMVISGTFENAAFNTMLDKIADGLTDLQNDEIVVVYKPFHEWNFWWNPNNGFSTSTMRNLWRYAEQYLTKNKGIHNVLWMYAPKGDSGVMNADWYPGDDVVDIIGISEYAALNNWRSAQYDKMIAVRKPYGHGEFGPGFPAEKGYSMKTYLETMKQNMPAAIFAMNWWKEWGIQNQEDSNAYMNDPYVINAGEINWTSYL